MEAICRAFSPPITSSAIHYPLNAPAFCLCWCRLFTKTKLLDAPPPQKKERKKTCLLPWKVFEIRSAYINKFGCVYSVSLLITRIQWYLRDETSHKFGLTSREALCMRKEEKKKKKCVHIMFSLPLYISEGSHPNKYSEEGGEKTSFSQLLFCISNLTAAFFFFLNFYYFQYFYSASRSVFRREYIAMPLKFGASSNLSTF